jgi:hypothetical protein
VVDVVDEPNQGKPTSLDDVLHIGPLPVVPGGTDLGDGVRLAPGHRHVENPQPGSGRNLSPPLRPSRFDAQPGRFLVRARARQRWWCVDLGPERSDAAFFRRVRRSRRTRHRQPSRLRPARADAAAPMPGFDVHAEQQAAPVDRAQLQLDLAVNGGAPPQLDHPGPGADGRWDDDSCSGPRAWPSRPVAAGDPAQSRSGRHIGMSVSTCPSRTSRRAAR